MDQIHSTHIARLDLASADGIQADGAVTGSARLACTVMVADCLPVLLCNVHGTHVAAVHAGWRGLVGQNGRGVVEEAVSALVADAAFSGGIECDCMAWLGPCIGPEAFEVGDEVRAAFVTADAAAESCFRPLGAGKWLADLPALARQRLQSMGVSKVYGNDGSPQWCTVTNPSRFFSYRRDGVTGRMAACIWRID
jgi:YfiH family protein